MEIDHVGYLVADISKAIQVFLQMGFLQETGIIVDDSTAGKDPARNVYLCFLRNGSTRIELVSPIDEKSDVFSTLKRQGEGPYHLCFQTDNLEEKIQELKKTGWLILKRPAKAVAFDNARVVFLFNRNGGMIELVEMKEKTNETA